MKRLNGLFCAAAVSAAMAGAVQAATFSFDAIGQTYTQDFNDYRGSAATLPDHMFVTWDTDRTSEPFQGVNTGAFTAYTADQEDFSFGIRERNPVDLRNARLYFEFTNNTGVPITGFEVSYDVEAWFVGDRRNRIRLKYDDAFGGNRFETDIFSTDNPSPLPTPVDTDLDGSLPENRVTVTGFVDLTTLAVNVFDDSRDFFGVLNPGESAFFRWQFSNTTGDGGSLRSGLAINNVSFTPVPEPAGLALLAVGGLALLRRRSA